MSRLIGASDCIGEMTGWAVRQSPYLMPDGLREALTVLAAAIAKDWHDGVGEHRMRWFDSATDLERWFREKLEQRPEYRAWNRPKSGHAAPFVITTRFGGPHSDDDIIDLGALWNNVARSCWQLAEEYERPAPDRPKIGG